MTAIGRKLSIDSVMTKQYEVHIPPAQAMKPIGEQCWFARARVKQTGTEPVNDFVRLPGEWHGRRMPEGNREAAEDWAVTSEPVIFLILTSQSYELSIEWGLDYFVDSSVVP